MEGDGMSMGERKERKEISSYIYMAHSENFITDNKAKAQFSFSSGGMETNTVLPTPTDYLIW